MNIIKMIITYEMQQILPNIGSNSKHINSIPKYLTSDIGNKDFLVKGGDGKYVVLSPARKITFDSGNTGTTVIGRNIVNELKLKVNRGCIMEATGIAGHVKQCGDYVELFFKFSNDYPMANNKEYSILAFVDDGNSINTLLFGHANGLDLLFNDNYAIKGQFDADDKREADKVNKMQLVMKAYKILNIYLDNFLSNPMLYRKKLLPMLTDASPVHIHTYYTIVPHNMVKKTFNKIYESEKIIKQLPISEKERKDLLDIINMYITKDFK